MTNNAPAIVLLAFALGLAPPAWAAAPTTLSYFCQASVAESQTFFATGVFTVAASTGDVTDAWRKHVAGLDSKARKTALCQGGVDVASLEELRTLTTSSTTGRVVDVDWSYKSAAD